MTSCCFCWQKSGKYKSRSEDVGGMVAVTESSGMAALQSQALTHHQPDESLNRSVHFDPEQLQVSSTYTLKVVAGLVAISASQKVLRWTWQIGEGY